MNKDALHTIAQQDDVQDIAVDTLFYVFYHHELRLEDYDIRDVAGLLDVWTMWIQRWINEHGRDALGEYLLVLAENVPPDNPMSFEKYTRIH